MKTSACKLSSTAQMTQRRRIAWLMLGTILILFWFFSRYPDLWAEYSSANNHQLLNRDVGVLSKDAMLATHNVIGPLDRLWRATIDWLETNKYGMTFGFLFSAAILVLLEQSRTLRNRAQRIGLRGVLSGLILGMPLGVCTNCATPVALGLRKSGVSDDASFSTLIASPSLNPIGLLIIFLLFPYQIGLLRVGILLFFLFLILPLLTRAFGINQAPIFEVQLIDDKEQGETWSNSLSYCISRYGHYLGYLFKRILPLMVLMGFMGVLMLIIFPLQNFLLADTTTIWQIMIAGIIGTILPTPMFVDIVLVYMLYSMGLSAAVSTTLLLTMAPTSAFALFVMGRYVNWRLSLAIGLVICGLGILAGIGVLSYQQHLGMANSIEPGFKPFTVAKTVKSKAPFDLESFSSFFGSGVSIVDYNHDGLSDIFLPGNHGSRLFKNIGDMQFKEVIGQTGITANSDSMAGVWGDFNNDGLIDLYLVNYRNKKGMAGFNRLYQNKGNGQFIDVTQKMRLQAKDFSSSASWADYDNDGDLDLFVANYGKIWADNNADIEGISQKDRLYRNDGAYFTDVTAQAGVGGTQHHTKQILDIDSQQLAGNRGFSFQGLWFDYNNDHLIDLFVTQDFGTSQLYQNNGDGTFSNKTNALGLNVYGTNMGVSPIDINQDGFWDLLVSTGNNSQLWLNRPGQKFINTASNYGLANKTRFGWGVAAVDYDNSGDNAFFMINGPTIKGAKLNSFQSLMAKISSENMFYVPKTKQNFINFDKKFRLYNTMIGRGLAMGDLNNDGHIDMVISNRDNHQQMIIYQNQTKKNASLQLKLIGRGKINRMAIGTKVSVYTHNKVQHKLLTAGSSFLSQHSDILHFGLGQASRAIKVVITWPNGKQQVFYNLKAGRHIIKG